jgi:predicted RNA binding protein YcfA (HicA-like mRNA interferase family)
MYKNCDSYRGVSGISGWIPLGLLRSVSGKEAIEAFIKAGGTVRCGKGDHMNIKMPNGQLITIPISGDLKIGLLKSAIRKAGLDDEEFIMLLEE